MDNDKKFTLAVKTQNGEVYRAYAILVDIEHHAWSVAVDVWVGEKFSGDILPSHMQENAWRGVCEVLYAIMENPSYDFILNRVKEIARSGIEAQFTMGFIEFPDLKTFTIPVEWTVCGKVTVRAHSIEDAIDIAQNDDSIALPYGDYLDDSWSVSDNTAEEIMELYN